MKRWIISLFTVYLFVASAPMMQAQGLWIDQSISSVGRLWAVSFKDTVTGWSVGVNGAIYKTTNQGYVWQQQTGGVTTYLSGVHFIGDEGWTCGENGIILHTNNGGATWNGQISGTMQPLYDIFMSSTSNGIAVGASKTIIYTTDGGMIWNSAATVPGTSVSLYGVYMIGTTAYVCGGSSRIYKSVNGGVNWSTLPPPVGLPAGTQLEGIYFLSATSGYMTGDGGYVIKTVDGNSFSVFSSGSTGRLNACSFIDDNTGWAIATGIDIRFTSNGGSAWRQQSSPVNSTMYGMDFPSATSGWAVGDAGKIIHYTIDLPEISSETDHGFGILLCGNIKTDTILVRNIGHAPLNILGVQFTGPHASEFTLLSPASGITTILPQDTSRFIVKWTAVSVGTKTASMKIISNDPATPVWTVRLSAQKDSVFVQANPTTLDFGSICINDSVRRNITVSSGGTVPLALIDVSFVSGDSACTLIAPMLPAKLTLGATDSLVFQFHPTRQGLNTSVYKLIFDKCNREILITLRGTGKFSSVSIIPAGYNFGSVAVGQSVTQQFKIIATGNAPSNIVSISLVPATPEYTFQNLPSSPLSLNVGQEKTFSITFAPMSEGFFNPELCINADAQCPYNVCTPLVGIGGVSPKISPPASIIFSDNPCSTIVDDTVYIRNTGGADLVITGAAFSGTSASRFSLIAPQVPVTISAGDSSAFILRLTDSIPGLKTSNLILTHDDSQNSPTTIPITAQKEIASFVVQGDSIRTIQSCIAVGTARSFKIYNGGSAAITVNEMNVIRNGNIFHVAGNTLPSTIQPGQIFPFEITFTPEMIGQFTGKIEIRCEPCGLTQVLSINGLGIKSKVDGTPTAIAFGSVNTGTVSDTSIEFTNTGTVNTTIHEVRIIPPVPGLQIISVRQTPFRFDIGEKFSVRIRFAPTTTGRVQAQLCVITATPCQDTSCIPVEGNAASLTLSVNRSGLNYTVSPCGGSSSCDTIRMTNAGSSSVNITDLIIVPAGNIFSITAKPNLPLTLTAGESRLLTVCAGAAFIGAASATLSILNTDQQRSRIDVPLTASRDSSAITYSTSAIQFGTLASCDTRKTVTFTIKNSGSAAEIITADNTIDPAYTFSPPFPLIVQAGELKVITAQFAPKQFRSFDDSLILTSSVCSTKTKMLFNGVYRKPVYIAAPTSLIFSNTPTGSVATRTVRFENQNNFSSRIRELRFIPSDGVFTTNAATPITLATANNVDLPILFAPPDTGVFLAHVCIIIDLPCADTMCIDIMGRGVRSNLAISKSQIVFSEQTQCELPRDTVSVTNRGSSPVTLLSSSITGAGQNYFGLVNSIITPEVLSAGASRSFIVEFRPATAPDGLWSASLHLETSDAQLPSIDISLQGERISQKLPQLAAVDFGNVIVGDSGTVQISITNPGASLVCIDRVAFPPRVTMQTSLPLCLQPGEQKNISLSWSPITIGSLSAPGILHVDVKCRDSILVSFKGNGIPGGILQTPTLQFGFVATCLMREDTIIIENTYTTSASMTGISLSGIDTALFRIIQPTSLPVTLAPSAMTKIIIRFSPMISNDGLKQATCTTTFRVDTTTRTRVTQIEAQAITPGFIVASVNFPQSFPGSSSQQTIDVVNTTPFTMTFSSVSTNDSVFTIQSITPPLPAIIAPGQKISITLRFTPSAEKKYTALLYVQSSLPCAAAGTGTLTGSGKAPNAQLVNLSIPTLHGKLDEIIQIPLQLSTDISTAQVSSWAGDITFNRTMLYPRRVITGNTLSQNMTVVDSYDQTNGHWKFTAANGQLLPGTAPLLLVEMQVILGNNVATPLTISPSFDFTSGFARVVQRTNGLFQLEGYCRAGDRLIRTNGNFTLQQNHPNPFSAGSVGNPITTIEYEIAFDGHVSLIVTTALGLEVARLVDEWKKGGRHTVEFNAARLPSGVYYYTLLSGRFRDVKKMVVAR